MEKFDIKISYNNDSTSFQINKTASLGKLIKFIEENYEEIKNQNYEILYNNMDIKLINLSQNLISIFKDEENEISLNLINVEEQSNSNLKINIICSYESKIMNFSINPSLTFQKFKYNILAFFPELEQDNYIINYNDTDITNIYSNDKLIKDIFKINLSSSNSLLNTIEIKLESKLKTIIEYYKRCSFCHDKKANNICKKCCIANCDKCSFQDNHHLTKNLNYILIRKFKKFEKDTLNDILEKINLIKRTNEKLNSDNLSEFLLEKIELINTKFISSKDVIIKIKDTQMNNLKIILDNIINKHHPEEISTKLKNFYNEVLNYKNNPFYDCEESMKKINEYLKRLNNLISKFEEYKNMLDEFVEKYNKCIDLCNKIEKILDKALNDFINVFKGISITQNCSQLMKIYNNSKILIYNYDSNQFNLIDFIDEDNKFKNNFNNFIQVNYTYNNHPQLFIITGMTSDDFFIYDNPTNEMKYIGSLKYSHYWYPNLIPFKKNFDNKSQLFLFCLSGSYSNKCEVLIFKEEIINKKEEEKKEEEKKEEEKKDEEIKEEEKKEEEKKEEDLGVIENKDGISGVEAVEKALKEMNFEEEKKEENNNNNNNIENNNNNDNNNNNANNNNENLENKELENKPFKLEWKEIPSTKINHGQSISFILNNKYLYLLFGYDSKLNQINIIERLNIEDINSLLIENGEAKSNWENIEYKNPNNIPNEIYYSSILKINDNKILLLGGLKDKNEVNGLYKFDANENSILKFESKINIENVKFVNEKNFILLNQDNSNEDKDKKEFGIIDINNTIHLISEKKLNYRATIFKQTE